MAESAVRIGLVLPDVLGTYGDSGNAMVLRQRLRWRGLGADVLEIHYGDAVPDCLDLYLLGGGEDEAQALAAGYLRDRTGLRRAAGLGAVVFGVCAGLQVLGTSFVTGDGSRHDGLNLLDAATAPGRRRAVGEIVVETSGGLGAGQLTGFENHFGVTKVGPGSRPLGRVTAGAGNGDGTDGALTGHVLATYLHGPVLARNPALADLLIGWVTGAPPPDLPLPEVDELRRERLRAARGGMRR